MMGGNQQKQAGLSCDAASQQLGPSGGVRRLSLPKLKTWGRKDVAEFTEDRAYPAGSKDEEWVEYVDALGRTRKCMRRDLPSQQRQMKDLVREATVEKEGGREGVETGQGLRKEAPDLMDEQTRLDMLRQKWEEQEMENLAKDDIHYSDIRFNEARTHGAGFYKFSNDESKREGEQGTLKRRRVDGTSLGKKLMGLRSHIKN